MELGTKRGSTLTLSCHTYLFVEATDAVDAENVVVPTVEHVKERVAVPNVQGPTFV